MQRAKTTAQLQLKNPKVAEFVSITQQNKQHINQMREENSILSDQLITQKQKNTSEETQLNLNLLKLQQECALYAQKIETETKRKQDLEELVQQMRDRLSEQQKHENASSGAELPKKLKKVKKQEITLQQIHQKHNEQLAEIQELKEMLNIARRERVIYSTVFKGIERDAIDKQRDFLLLIKQSELLKVELKVLVESLDSIQSLSEVEQQRFLGEYQQLFKGPSTDSSLESKQTISLKNNTSKLMKTMESNDHQTHNESHAALSPTSELKSYARGNTMNLIETADKLKDYEQRFEKLYVETGMKSVEQVVYQFNNQDQLVDDIYLEINNVTSSIDLIEREIKEINSKLGAQLERGNQQRLRKEREQVIAEGTKMNAMQRTDHKIASLKEDLNHQRDVMMQIQSALDLNILDEDVNEWNLNQYSRALEDKINDILTVAKSLEMAESPTSPKQRLQFSFDEANDNDLSHQSKDMASQKLDDLLNTMEKIKESEKIISPEELKQQSLEVIAREVKAKNNRKSKF